MSEMTITYTRKGDVHTLNTETGALGELVVDNTKVAQEFRQGTAKQLLGASALFCYCSALVGALEARGAVYEDIMGKATLHLGSNERGQGRIRVINIEVKVALAEKEKEVLERCVKIMNQGCLVTSSLHEGIRMEYKIIPEYSE